MNKHVPQSSRNRILIEEISPYGNLVAYVESNEETCYFYIMPVESRIGNVQFQPAALWLKNLVPAPEKFQIEKGKPPLMPEKNTQYPQGSQNFSPEHLKIVWFSDGCGASLYDKEELIAIIPPWSSPDYIAGYTKEAEGFDTPFLPLPKEDSQFYQRIQDNQKYWDSFNNDNEYKQIYLQELEKIWGNRKNHYKVSHTFLPIVEIWEFFSYHQYIYITIGMSRHPLPKVEFFFKGETTILKNSFVELILFLDSPISRELLDVLGQFSTYPWRTLTFIDYFHSFELIFDKKYDGFFTKPLTTNKTTENLPELFPHIKFLELIPATQEDFLIARGKGVEFAIKKILSKYS